MTGDVANNFRGKTTEGYFENAIVAFESLATALSDIGIQFVGSKAPGLLHYHEIRMNTGSTH